MDERLNTHGGISEQFDIAVIDVSGARRDNARDMADERLTAEMQGKGGFRGMVRRVWKGNLAHEYYRQKYFHESLGEIDATSNMYAGHDGLRSDQAMGVVVDRFTSAYGDEVMHNGEKRYQLDEANPTEQPVRTAISNLISSFAKGDLDETNFEEEKNRVLKELVGKNPEMFGEGAAFADNMLEVAQNVKAAVRHGRGLDAILAQSKFVVGKARMGVRSEAKFNKVDTVVGKIRESKVGHFFNESTVSAAAAIVVGVTKWGAQRTVSSALMVTGGVGAGGAVFAAMRESKHFKEERTQHMRESAMGQEFDPSAKRRGKLEQTRYETKGAQELTGELHSIVNPAGEVKTFDTDADYTNALSQVAEVGTRIKMSDQQNIDLIHFSNIDTVEKERFTLDVALANARTRLSEIHGTRGDELLPAEHKGKTFDALLAEYENTFVAAQDELIQQRDTVFNKMRRTQMAKAAATGLIVGAVIGAGVQEGMAHIYGIGNNVYGLGEHVKTQNMGKEHHSTLLHGIFQGKETHSVTSAQEQLHQLHLSNKANLSLPEGFTAHQNVPGHWEIIGANGKPYTDILMNKDGTISAQSVQHLGQLGFPVHESTVIHHLSGQTHEMTVGQDKFIIPKEFNAQEVSPGHWQLLDANHHVASQYDLNPDGTITQAGLANLQHAGIHVNTTSHTDIITGPPIDRTVDSHTFVANHMSETTRVHRGGWYDNDTSKFDLNELKLHAGGVDNSWFDSHGNVVIDVSKMTHGGSFHAGQHADPFQLTGEGKLTLGVSVSKGTQANVFMSDIVRGPDGSSHAIITSNNPVYQLFKMNNGKREFHGRYLEIMETTGIKDKLGEHVKVLSTFVGKEGAPMHDVIPGATTSITHHINTITMPPSMEQIQNLSLNGARITESSGDILPIIPIPLRARRGLELAKKKATLRNPNIVGDYYGGRSLEELQEWLRDNPDLIQTRREIVRPDGTKAWVEKNDDPVERKIDRERAVLSDYIMNERDKNPDHMRLVDKVADAMVPMSNDCRVTVNVPAWMEEKNLGTLLSEYIAQVDKEGNTLSPELYEVNILVNRKTGAPADKSVDVIKKFITDFETVNGFKPRVNYFDIEVDPPFNTVGYARKLLTDAVVERSLRRGAQTQPLYMETEDADHVRVDTRVVTNVITKMDENPQLDAVRGVQDRSPEYLKLNDYLFVRRRAADFFEILARDKKYRDPLQPNWNFTWNRVVTGGWNTAYSAEAYALIGGYDSVVAGEDMSIGEKITMIRGDGSLPNLEVVGKVYSRIDSSPRRFIEEVKGKVPAYADFGNEETNEAIRNNPISKALEDIKAYAVLNEENQAAFADYLSYMHTSWAKSVTPTDADAVRMTQRLFFWLGLKKDDYEITNDGVVFKNWDNLKAALENYKLRTA